MPTSRITGRRTEVEINSYELAWAAGFYDGEGSSGCYKTKANVKLQLTIAQKELFPLVRFHRAVLGRGKIRRARSRNINILQLTRFEDVQAVIALLWKFLTPIKRNQYKIALKLYDELYDPDMIEKWRTKNSERLSNWNYINNPLKRIRRVK